MRGLVRNSNGPKEKIELFERRKPGTMQYSVSKDG